MALGSRVRSGRRLALALAAIVMMAVIFGSATVALAEVKQVTVNDQTMIIDTSKPVVEQTCSFCHANIANTKNYASEIIFKHGYHAMIQCSGCHSKFPHAADAAKAGVDTSKPTMKGCFNCHGLRHGPMGLIATDQCEKCHNTPKIDLKPGFHTWDWAGKPHVAPGEAEYNTKCAMCHKKEWCTDCHNQKGIRWEPKSGSWAYDAKDGCQACHGSDNLRKDASNGTKSFTVTGLQDSAHRDVSCQSCHIDFVYNDEQAPSKVWQVNAGLGCAQCHEKQTKPELAKPVAEWKASIHYAKLQAGNANSANCGSCHGGHFITRLDTAYAKQMMHGSAYRVCARCHADQYASYNDYYHGAAYKKGASDAPACWDCHGTHDIRPASDKGSTVAAANVSKTCGQCHKGSQESFGQAAGQLIHTKTQTVQQNPIMQLIARVRGWIG